LFHYVVIGIKFKNWYQVKETFIIFQTWSHLIRFDVIYCNKIKTKRVPFLRVISMIASGDCIDVEHGNLNLYPSVTSKRHSFYVLFSFCLLVLDILTAVLLVIYFCRVIPNNKLCKLTFQKKIVNNKIYIKQKAW